MTTKKLTLSDFLSGLDSIIESNISNIPVSKDLSKEFSYSLSNFFEDIVSHPGIFTVNGLEYTNIIPSLNSLYFFNEYHDKQTILIFDPIIDIKKRNSEYTIFYYSEHIITISLGVINDKTNKKFQSQGNKEA